MENQSTASNSTWVTEATMMDQTKAQPWAKVFEAKADDPKFEQTRDMIELYQEGIKTCHAEGTLAA